jgi:hypothetical protein
MTNEKLSRSDRDTLCDAVAKAWAAAGKSATKVEFTWHGRQWVSTKAGFRMLVEPAEGGGPKVGRWQ